MASILRRAATSYARKYVNTLSSRDGALRLISSTPKKDTDTTSTATTTTNATLPAMGPEDDKNWISYGYDLEDKEKDRNIQASTFFFGITLIMVLGGFGWAYYPDTHSVDWASREAFLQIRHREAHGLPLVDPNYVDPSTIVLPSEEELGEIEIVI